MSFRVVSGLVPRRNANALDPNGDPAANPNQVPPPPAQQQRRRRPRPGEPAPQQPGF